MKNRLRGRAPAKVRVQTVDQTHKLAEAKGCHQAGDFSRALRLYEEMLAVDPKQLEALFLSSNILINQQNFPLAKVRIEQALQLQPQNAALLFNAGLILVGMNEWQTAAERLRTLLTVQPQHQRGLFLLGHALCRLERWEEAAEILHKSLALAPEHAESHLLLSDSLQKLSLTCYAHYHKVLGRHLAGRPLHDGPKILRHTLFLNPERAMQSARAGHRVQETIQKAVPQVCYYVGQPVADAPANLFVLPSDSQAMMDYFIHSPMTHPDEIDFDPASLQEREKAKEIVQVLYKALLLRSRKKEALEQHIKDGPAPTYGHDGRLRIFIATSRKLDVMLSNSRDLRYAFEQLGCEVKMAMEPHEHETYHAIHFLQQIIDFQPQILLDINNYFKLMVHPECYCIYWYTDPMPVLVRGNRIHWRERDLLYSLNQEFAQLIYNCGGSQVQIKGFCYDQQLFHDQHKPRKRKAVFVGSTHDFVLKQYPNCQPVLAELEKLFVQGIPLTPDLLAKFTALAGVQATELATFFWGYVVRNVSVRWLCELAGEIEVEVYGHGWDKDPVVRPFYRGAVAHGQAVNDLYNAATYVLVPHQNDLQSQRLVEAAACGITPIVYDCRFCADPPHWDENCLWYRTQEQLRQRLHEQPPQDPKGICRGRSYLEFAQQLLHRVGLPVQSVR
ncbi:MAG: tetratricopeptide repeat protein [Magnetococcales bacterium]|nr:tetratricopeptide repeat protein [Magnetococcales bacterium]MBF0115243.1 tetratricopeptide repeat protein [Magnetococcales bacterium]